MKFCPECGHELETPNPKFCPNCGTSVTNSATTNADQPIAASQGTMQKLRYHQLWGTVCIVTSKKDASRSTRRQLGFQRLLTT
ncbi:zinc-ribbon domain-containing protein [Lacticaseibacillus pantheris]|uniref:zinc-ribbon domain-containing protein n=1 Tax=Lacticaseibacillus pantheris TaxID=171523 RepID=UPI0009EA47BA|nr:zinc-ribbon domain-containing protein [Lacticaseibacillus pantheris]